eukprot:c15671_g1_i2 orf=220-2820(-)
MRLLSIPLLETTIAGTPAFSVCQACISAHHASASLRFSTQRLFTRRQTMCKAHKRGVVCFQDLNFDLGNVSEALQQIGDRVSKNQHIARVGEFLKRDGGSREQSQRASEGGGKAFWEGSNLPFPKHTSNGDFDEEDREKHVELDFPFVSNPTFNTTTPRGELSAAAISCIEQFSRLNGSTGSKVTRNFYAQCPVSVQNEARYLVEYCCFTYLSRCNTDFHPQLKDTAFRRLMFITMLAWQQPYASAQKEHEKVVGEEAFSRIAPVVPGVADRPTAHHLFRALTNSKEGLSFSVWDTYLSELLRVHEERSQHKADEGSTLSLEVDESVLCVGANKRQPVQMWNSNNIAWPGRLTLTERALYFEPNGMFQHQMAQRLDLSGGHGSVERKKVGPLGAPVFDTAIAVMSDAKSEPWILEFVDFSGDGRREVWFAFVDELLSAYSFISEYGPGGDDPFLHYVQGSQHGRKKAIGSAIDGIARVQAVQSTLGRVLEYPGRLLQFSHLKNAPCGDLVKQTLAVGFWGGHLDTTRKDLKKLSGDNYIADAFGTGLHVVNVDGSTYLQRWMRSPTWDNSTSSSFWKHKAGGKGLILGKDLVVGDFTYTERAVKSFKDQSQMLERTKATIDGALVKGIPSNIDLLKELMLPFTVLSLNLRKLQKWENPPSTVVFLAVCSLVIYKSWLKYFVPIMLLTSAVLVFTLHNLKPQSRLGDTLGRIVIREQPPLNTLQKIIALKEALAEVEIQIQKANIALLKLRNLALAGHPQGRNMVAFALLAAALVLMFVPFRYVCMFVLLDQFTCELEFRRGMVQKFVRQVQDWWEAIPAAPVVILPYERYQSKDGSNISSEVDESSAPTKGEVIAEAVREWVAESF